MITLVRGNALHIPLPDKSVQCVVTSPPYWGLRDYGTACWVGGDEDCDHRHQQGGEGATSAKQNTSTGTQTIQYRGVCAKCGATRVDAQLGLERSPEEYVANMVAVFREVWRVLRDDGTLWLNLGDSYWGGKGQSGSGGAEFQQMRVATGVSFTSPAAHVGGNGKTRPQDGKHSILKPKDMVGIPWRVAFALQADGWYLRHDAIEKVELYCPCGCGYILEERIWRYSQDREIIWSKPNPMPESVTDRPTKSHEYLFLLTKAERYYYDAEAIKEPGTWSTEARQARASDNHKSMPTEQRNGIRPKHSGNGYKQRGHERAHQGFNDTWDGMSKEAQCSVMRNKRSVWTIATSPYPEAHFATFPPALVEPCVLAGTSAKGQCPECGAPWVRVKEREFVPQQDVSMENGIRGANGQKPAAPENGLDGAPRGTTSITTTGWQPSCSCYDELYRLEFRRSRNSRQRRQQDAANYWFPRARRRPGLPWWKVDNQLVIDPFDGTGTVCQVAQQHGRNSVGIELKQEYVKLAGKRTRVIQIMLPGM